MNNKSLARKAGLPPGTLVHVGTVHQEDVKIKVLLYNGHNWEEHELPDLESLASLKECPGVCWLHISGLHKVEIIEGIGQLFKIHPLVLEDIVNTHQRPKLEDHGHYGFIALKRFIRKGQGELGFEQISLLVGEKYLISFQERSEDCFSAIRERIKSGKGRLCEKGADYLAYAFIDAIVDDYYLALEYLGENIEHLEVKTFLHPEPALLQEIHHLKKAMLLFRKAVWPLREVINALQRQECLLFKEDTLLYLRDVYDHTIQVIDNLEMYRDMLTGMLDIYLSSTSYKLNEIMKVLTIISTIFIPLTFIAGLYGMNFKNMPELEWDWGYPAVLLVMLVISGCMVVYFRRKKWLI